MDTSQAIRSFCTVVEEGGFAAAARRLGTTRSAITKQVAQLERQLGTQLLVRSTRRVSQTESGARFYARARPLQDEFDALLAATTDEKTRLSGTLRVNAPMSFGADYLTGIITDFINDHPDIHVELVLNDRLVDPIEEGFDLSVRVAEAGHYTSLRTEILASTDVVLCAAPAYDISGLDHPRALKHHRCLHYGYQRSGSQWTLASGGRRQGFAIHCALWSNNGEVLRQAAIKGQGIALLPTFLIGAALQDGSLRRVLPDWQAAPLAVQLLYPRSDYLPEKTRRLAETIRSRIGNPPPWTLIS